MINRFKHTRIFDFDRSVVARTAIDCTEEANSHEKKEKRFVYERFQIQIMDAYF